MIHLYINRGVNYGPWGGGAKAVNALYEFAGLHRFKIVGKQGNTPDVMLAMGMGYEDDHLSIHELVVTRAYADNRPKLFMRVNNCDACRDGTDVDSTYAKWSRQCDGVIFVSDWSMNLLTKRSDWGCTNNVVIRNGVDCQTFYKRGVHLMRRPEDKVKIVTHHWSDNVKKSGEITLALDEFVGKNSDKFEYTFIGRTRCELKHTRVIPPMNAEELGEELNRHHVYVSESRFDTGPNHVMESIACGLPTYVHRDGGGAVEFAGKDHQYDDAQELFDILQSGHAERRFAGNSRRYVRPWLEWAGEMFHFMSR